MQIKSTSPIFLGIIVGSVVLLLLLCLLGIDTVAPSYGEEAVLIKKPFFFGTGGVVKEPVKTGRVFVAASTSFVKVNMQPQAIDVKFNDFMTKDGVPMDFNTEIRIQVLDSVGMVENFGDDFFAKNVQAAYTRIVRSSVKKYGMNEVAIDTSAIDAIDTEVYSNLSEYIKSIKIPMALLNVNVGKANPPDAVLTQRIETAQQEQRVNTEKMRKLAEDQRLAAEQSRASADNAYRDSMHLSPEQFVNLEQVKMEREACIHKDAHCTFLIGTNAQPVVSTH